jgi:hypothetical protein
VPAFFSVTYNGRKINLIKLTLLLSFCWASLRELKCNNIISCPAFFPSTLSLPLSLQEEAEVQDPLLRQVIDLKALSIQPLLEVESIGDVPAVIQSKCSDVI